MFDKADIIRVPWKFFDDNDLVSVVNNDYSIVNRFTRPVAVEKQCNWTKAIIRGGLKLFIPDDNDSIPHLVNVDGVKYAVDANGNQNRNMSIRDSCDYSNCQLNHYSTKTIEEFVLNKIKKGYATSVDANILNKKYFFNFNTYTKEKEDLYNNLTKKNVDIFIFTHKNFETERTNSIYKIVCNKNDDISSDSLEVIKLDCELSNIGFSEWQKMYELYKQEQVKLNDYVGLAHYHRFLKFCDDVNIVPDIKQFFEKYDILDKPPVNLGNLREQYKRSHNVKDFDLAFDILKEMHPELHGKIDKVVNNGVLFDSNIMIMKKADFLSLCEFVFPVLFEYCKRVGIDRTSDESFFDYKNKHISEYMKFHKQGDYNFDEQARICSYLAERIATVFLFTNFNNIGILPMVEK